MKLKMSNIVIQVENLSKQYRLGEVGTGTLSHDLKRWWYRARGKEDPYLKVGEVNDRTVQSDNDYVWALKDINFEVKQGEVLGIIGRNGAGKSTLLKILSKTTTPTTGHIKVKGRIASLLEVGTGFHPEMTGRENIFLNGAILGMTKKEIKRKFDEIVDFAGVERYIDTPVKRYSSGMYVRLAFAVAAHLEPEILIVDEVLAVGDAEFQKKCLGKMKDVSVNEGRTVLFVSHNMGAVQQLCNSGLLLQNGLIQLEGLAENVVNEYIAKSKISSSLSFKRWGNKKVEFLEVKMFNNNFVEQSEFLMGNDVFLKLKIRFNEKITYAEIGINIKNSIGELITHIANFDDDFSIKGEHKEIKEIFVCLQEMYLSPNLYSIDVAIVSGADCFEMLEDILSFQMIEGDKIKRKIFPPHVKVFTKSKWNYQ